MFLKFVLDFLFLYFEKDHLIFYAHARFHSFMNEFTHFSVIRIVIHLG